MNDRAHHALNIETREQIEAAYRRMSREARYRPAAPSDGLGNITGPLHLGREASAYAQDWWDVEAEGTVYDLGCPDWGDRAAFIFTVEGARLICGVERKVAATLLRMAADALDARQP